MSTEDKRPKMPVDPSTLVNKKEDLKEAATVDKHSVLQAVRLEKDSISEQLKHVQPKSEQELLSQVRTDKVELKNTAPASKQNLLTEVRCTKSDAVLHDTPTPNQAILGQVGAKGPALASETLQVTHLKPTEGAGAVTQQSLLSDVRAQHGAGAADLQTVQPRSQRDLHTEVRTKNEALKETKTVDKPGLMTEVRHGAELGPTPVLKAEVITQALAKETDSPVKIVPAMVSAETLKAVSNTPLQTVKPRVQRDLHTEVRTQNEVLKETKTVDKPGLMSEVRQGTELGPTPNTKA